MVRGDAVFLAFITLFCAMQLSSASTNMLTVDLKERGIATSWFGWYTAAGNIGGMLGSFALGHWADHKVPAGAYTSASPCWRQPGPLRPAPEPWPCGHRFLWRRLLRRGLRHGQSLPHAVPGGARPDHALAGTFATACTPIIMAAPLIHGWLAGILRIP